MKRPKSVAVADVPEGYVGTRVNPFAFECRGIATLLGENITYAPRWAVTILELIASYSSSEFLDVTEEWFRALTPLSTAEANRSFLIDLEEARIMLALGGAASIRAFVAERRRGAR